MNVICKMQRPSAIAAEDLGTPYVPETHEASETVLCGSLRPGNRIKIPPSFCIRQCGEDIFTTIITAGGNKWNNVCKKSYKASRRVAYIIDF